MMFGIADYYRFAKQEAAKWQYTEQHWQDLCIAGLEHLGYPEEVQEAHQREYVKMRTHYYALGGKRHLPANIEDCNIKGVRI